jgi:Protein of unknown function (DUF2971)
MLAPKKLYKYQPFSTLSLSNLTNRQIWFSKPTAFNDPFDCAMCFRVGPWPDDEIGALYESLRTQFGKSLQFDHLYMSDGRPNERFRTECASGAMKSLADLRDMMVNERGVACFSEKNDDVLMWGHYADGHRGFCLEFDTSFEPFHKAFSVEYAREIPTVDPAVLRKTAPDGSIVKMFRTKFEAWSYEKEWRVFHREGNTPYGYGVDALTGIYFGSAMSETHRDIICRLVHGSPTKFFLVQRREDEFAVAISEFTYTPYDYQTRRDGRSTPICS